MRKMHVQRMLARGRKESNVEYLSTPIRQQNLYVHQNIKEANAKIERRNRLVGAVLFVAMIPVALLYYGACFLKFGVYAVRKWKG